MQNVTTKKFAEMCSVTDANIRGLIGRGKLSAVKDSLGNHLLDIEDPVNREYFNLKKSSSQEQHSDNTDIAKQNAQIDLSAIERITKRIEELAKEAGRTKLLTDNLFKEEQNAKYWQEKFFELQNSYDTVRNEKGELEKEILKQNLKNEQLEEANRQQRLKIDNKDEENKKLKNDNVVLSQQIDKISHVKNIEYNEKKRSFLGLFKK